jgi:hypothetical protein
MIRVGSCCMYMKWNSIKTLPYGFGSIVDRECPVDRASVAAAAHTWSHTWRKIDFLFPALAQTSDRSLVAFLPTSQTTTLQESKTINEIDKDYMSVSYIPRKE